MKLSELAATEWSGRDIKIATAVALAESRGKMDATNTNSNGTTDDGPWQVNSIHGYDRNRLRSDPAYSVHAAHEVWAKAGNSWRPWVTYNTGAYLVFMGRDAELTADDPGILSAIKDAAIGALGPAGLPIRAADELIGNPIDAVTGGIDTIGTVVSALANPSTYLRLGKGALGGALIILGVGSVVFVVANRVSSTPVAKAATGIIP